MRSTLFSVALAFLGMIFSRFEPNLAAFWFHLGALGRHQGSIFEINVAISAMLALIIANADQPQDQFAQQ